MAAPMRTRLSKAVRRGYRKTREKVPIETGNYPYVTARLKAKKALLIPKDVYARMLQMEASQIARLIGEGEYKQEVLKLGARFSGVDLIELATVKNLARVFAQITNFCEGHLKVMVSEYMSKWDVRNIKTILRGKLYGASAEDIMDRLVPAGTFSDAFLRGLAGMEKFEEVFGELGGTLYERALQRVGKQPAELTSLAEYEDALSQLYYGELLDAIPPTTFGSRLFRRFVQREIDILNLKTLLRLWTRGVKLERDVFLDGGFEIGKEELVTMLDLDQNALLERLSEYKFYDEISEDLKTIKAAGVSHLFRQLEKFNLTHAVEQAHLYPLSVIPVMDYLLSKEIEVQNLRIIARGKQSGLSTDVIKDLLVI